jgi:RNA polymerase sigma factor (sigma-70 family)
MGRAELWEQVSVHRVRLVRLARSRGLSADDAEDCVSEAMLRCVEFPNLDEERLGAFLTTVTVRLCADGYRARTYRDRLTYRLSAEPTVQPAAEEAVCDRAEATWLAARIDDLPPFQQAVVHARADGLSATEIAERLRLSRTAVESHIARARRALRSARASAWGVVLSRFEGLAVDGAAVSAAVGLLLVGPGLVPPEHHVRQPPVVVASDVPDAVRAADRVVVRPVPAPPVARPVAPSPQRGRAAAPSRPPDKHRPKSDVKPWVMVGPTGVGSHEGDDEYTELERLEQCITYGIDPWGEDLCRRPPRRTGG